MGGSIASSATSTGAAQNISLGASNYNVITWTPVQQACSYDVWRTAIPASGSPSTTGVIANVLSSAPLTFPDNGVNPTTISCANASNCAPTINTSGSIDSVLNAANSGYFISTGILNPQTIGTAPAAQPLITANGDVRVSQFTLSNSFTIGRVSITVGTGVTTSTVTVGIYDANLNKIFDTALSTPTTTSMTVVSNTVGPFILNPGVYYLAQSASTPTTLTALTITPQGTVMTQINTQTPRSGKCSNMAASGVLPVSCGTITAATTGYAVVLVTFER